MFKHRKLTKCTEQKMIKIKGIHTHTHTHTHTHNVERTPKSNYMQNLFYRRSRPSKEFILPITTIKVTINKYYMLNTLEFYIQYVTQSFFF